MMNKKQFLKAVADMTGMPRGDVERVIESSKVVLLLDLAEHGEASMPEIAKFKVKWTNARTARNPRTGEAIEVPAGRKLVCKASGNLAGAAIG